MQPANKKVSKRDLKNELSMYYEMYKLMDILCKDKDLDVKVFNTTKQNVADSINNNIIAQRVALNKENKKEDNNTIDEREEKENV